MSHLNPVYVTLFSKDATHSNIIKRFTNSEYSHSTISMDASLNNMYSFSGIPYNRGILASGFLRESIYSPNYVHVNNLSLYVIFFNDEEYKLLQEKIDWFIENYNKYKYSYAGLVQYILNRKEVKRMTENEKKKFFCSEFVSWIINSCKSGTFYDIMLSPGELSYNPKLKFVQSCTIKDYSEKKTISITKKLMKEYMEYADEAWVPKMIRGALNRIDEKEITNYTSFIDWKLLMDEFIKYFKNSDVNKRFELIELIIRKNIMVNPTPKNHLNEKICSEMKRISQACPNSPILYTSVEDSYVVFSKGHKTVSIDYPSLNMKSI